MMRRRPTRWRTDSWTPPGETADRLTIVAALWRAAGRPEASQGAEFTDVQNDPAVDWAAGAGIVNGYADGSFDASDPVSREQIAAMLWRCEGSPAWAG